MNEILSIRGLTKSYRNIRALNKLNLEIKEGQAYGILGPNGSGKTTTLSIIMGILKADQGSFSWFGEAPAPGQRRAIGSLIENPHFYPYLSLVRNLQIVCDIKRISYESIEPALESTKLLKRKRSRFSTLSLGMKQRLGIAAALLGNPKVLVLDEPTNGLDPEGIAEVREIILQQVERGSTLIMASHILNEVEKICDHVAILKKGELLADGPVRELLAEEEILEVAAADNQALLSVFSESELVKDLHTENGLLILTLARGTTAADINLYAHRHKQTLHHMNSRKRSLEAQFLELVKEDQIP